MDRNGGQYYYIYDGLGSTRQLVNSSGGAAQSINYDAYGQPDTASPPTNFLFNGQQYDPLTHLYYLRARYYNPFQGRFLSQDPLIGGLAEPASLHRYAYACSDPVSRCDPSGQAGDQISTVVTLPSILTLTCEQIAVTTNTIMRIAAGAAIVVTSNQQIFLPLADDWMTIVGDPGRGGGPPSQILYHYTSYGGAIGILGSHCMFASPAEPEGLPAGAYATDIRPDDANWTRQALIDHLYLPRQRDGRVVDYCVEIDNSDGGFRDLTPEGHPNQWVKDASRYSTLWINPRDENDTRLAVPVSPLNVGPNLMRR
jgi:RHS repeat-associated protein